MKLQWTRAALADLEAINEWLARNADPETAEDQLTRIRLKARRMVHFPARGPLITSSHHYARAERTPYVLIYRIVGTTVQILRIRHIRENWRSSE